MEAYRINKTILFTTFFTVAMCSFSGCINRQFLPENFNPRDLDAESTLEFAEPKRKLEPSLLVPSGEDYRIGVGDRLEIEITGVEGSRTGTFVMPDGRIYYDLAYSIKVDGLTIKEVGNRLQESLRSYYTSPSVNVSLSEVRSRYVWFLGRINGPGLYPLAQPTTLLEGIALAGGLLTSTISGSTVDISDLSNSFVLRDGQVLPVNMVALMKEGDISQNIYLKNGDYIYIPSSLSKNIYILGSVVSPQALPYNDTISLVSAISYANGPTPEARLDRVLIIRGSFSSPKVAVVNLREILSGRASDFKLEPFDIVWVADRPFATLEEYFWSIFDSAASSIAVREGANAVGGSTPNVVFPINPQSVQ